MSGCGWQYVSGLNTTRHALGKAPVTSAQQTSMVALGNLGNLGALDTADVWPVVGAFGIAVVVGVALAAVFRT